MSAEDDCPFCEIVNREDPDAREVYRDPHVIAIFPTEPAVLGHTMVIPRQHVETIWDLDEALGSHMSTAVLRVAHAIRSALNPEGLNVIQSNGAAATQTVKHVHVHLVPRNEGDRIGRIWPPESDFSEWQKDEAEDMLIGALRRLSGASLAAAPQPKDERSSHDEDGAVEHPNGPGANRSPV